MGRTTAPKFRICLLAGFVVLYALSGRTASAWQLDGFPPATKALFTQAANGNPRAQATLGYLYEYGRGVPQNYATAFDWYHAAAEQGDANGQYLLGLMYEKGHGVPRSDSLAYMWLNLATAHAAPRDRDFFAHVRDAVASKLTPAQMANAQWLAQQFIPKLSQ